MGPLREERISVALDAEGALHLQGRRVADAQALESALGVLLSERLDPASRRVMFKCDETVDRSVFEPVLEAIARAGGVIIAVGDRPAKER